MFFAATTLITAVVTSVDFFPFRMQILLWQHYRFRKEERRWWTSVSLTMKNLRQFSTRSQSQRPELVILLFTEFIACGKACLLATFRHCVCTLSISMWRLNCVTIIAEVSFTFLVWIDINLVCSREANLRKRDLPNLINCQFPESSNFLNTPFLTRFTHFRCCVSNNSDN